MTSFLDCIATAVDTGRLGAKKAGVAEAAYADAYDDLIAKGVPEDKANYAAAHSALEATTELKHAERRARIATMLKETAIFDQIDKIKRPEQVLASRIGVKSAGMNSLMDQVDRTYAAVSEQIMASANLLVKEYDARFLGQHNPVENMDNVAYSAFGVHRDQAAEPLGLQVQEVYKLIRELENLEGATIPEMKNYGLPMRWDRFLTSQVSEDEFVSTMLAHGDGIDWENMRYAGKAIPEDRKEEMLRNSYQSIVNEGRNKDNVAFPNQENLATNLSRRRFILFKDPAAWLSVNKQFGKGNLYQQMLSDVASASRNIALMRVFGPSPAHGKAFAERVMQRKIAELSDGLNAKKRDSLRVAMNRELGQFEDQYKIVSHSVDYGDGDMLIQGMNTARSIAGTSLLGDVGILSLSDVFYGMAFRQMYNMPVVSLFPRYIKALSNFGAFKQQMIINGMFQLSNLTTHVHDAQRYTMGLEGSNLANRLSVLNYKITLASPLTEIGQGLAKNDFASMLAQYRTAKFDDIPVVELLRNLGVTEKDWLLVRDTPLQEPEYNFGPQMLGKGAFLQPVDMWRNAGSDAGRTAANKFMQVAELISVGSSPRGTIGARSLLGGSVDPARAHAQFIKSAGQFMIFPASIMFTHWKLALSAPTALAKAKRFGILFAYTTAAGALIQQLKELVRGNGFKDMTDPEFWAKSMVVGGAGGLFGDFVWNNIAAANHPRTMPIVQAAGKAYDAVAEPAKAVKQWVFGEDVTAKPARAELELIWGVMPKPAPFRLAMERMIYDPLLELSDPAAYEKKVGTQTRKLEDNNQTAWWGISD